ncbi:MAG: SUMF1/EgtB/PvdO family nonheme iron enzyme, partial [Phycisphaerales bacterium]
MSREASIAAVAAVVLACAAGAKAQVVIETVTVGNPGNDGELSGEGAGGWGPDRICGAVDYVYNIGMFEVTAGQYSEFLNAVADDDTYGLYSTGMWDSERGCKIERTGSSPNYSYSVGVEWADRPVNLVSWGDVARFANWLHNGQPGIVEPGVYDPVPQDENSTEDGSYDLAATQEYYGPDGQVIDFEGLDAALLAVVRESDATWVIPSEDEWYKAAYHYNDGVTGNYYDYPTQSDTAPTAEAPSGTDMTNGSANYYYDGAYVDPTHYRTEVGAYDAKPSHSPYGTFDQGGNVYEWNEAVLHDSYRSVLGGSYDIGGSLHAAYRGSGSYQPTIVGSFIGFRVADVSEPGPDIPTVSEWGLVATALLVLTAGTV